MINHIDLNKIVKNSIQLLSEEFIDNLKNEQPGDKLDNLIYQLMGFNTGLKYSTDEIAALELWKIIPLKMYEGSVQIDRSAAGNPKARYFCCISHRIYEKSGWANQSGQYSAYAQGENFPEAIVKAFIIACYKQIFTKK